jgi:proton-translocating NADH-quinone oxidoreductase chain N
MENLINQLTIIYLSIGIGIMILYGLWQGKDREYKDLEIGSIILIIISILISTNIIEKGGLLIGLIINLLGYSIIDNLMDNKFNKKESIINGIRKWELIILKLFIYLGYLIIIQAHDWIYIYIGIETISLTSYLLAGIKTGGQQQEASLKYFILGSLGSGLLLLGIVWIYKETGTIELINILDNQFGTILIIFALLLKLAAAPFHMWAPDVYEGSPTYITSIFAIYPKLVYIYIIYFLMTGTFSSYQIIISDILSIVGILSIIIGSIAAINQTKLKRFIAYSGISHTGWILLGLSTANTIGFIASFIYLIIYIIMNIFTFSLILAFNYSKIAEFSGFIKNHPLLSSLFSLNLMSMAGVPPLVGFVSKIAILYALFINNSYFIAIIAIIISIIGAFNYIRIIKFMSFLSSSYYSPDSTYSISLTLSLLLAISSWFIISGIYLIIPLIQLIIIF